MNTKTEWIDFSVTDLTQDEKVMFNQQTFEEAVGDQFVAVKVNEQNKPVLIWTEKYVCPIKFEILFGDSPVMVFERNPFLD